MNLFIDTNILLSFYHLTSDDLEELRKLSILIKKGEVTLHLPDQVIDEYRRNREIKIADAVRRLKDQKLNLKFPQLCKDYTEYSKLRGLQKEYEAHHAALLKGIIRDVEINSLKADQIIDDLCQKASTISSTDELVSKARLRMDIGNPPGKNGSLGDAINWEALLEKIPKNEALYLVSDDRDYFSPLDENNPKEFLVKEWSNKKNSKVTFYRRLSTFFKEHYPDIKLASELEKELLIKNLTGSSNFTTTHYAIRKLSKYDEFSSAQANEIAEASLANNQISLIIDDLDVHKFLLHFTDLHKDKINEETYVSLLEKLDDKKPDDDTDDETPF
tara:strand:+ start:743 stop:1735 length:993 start_codon:yes stop_codon:yes gene_type:complete